jgi:small GTP-binding protein
MSYDYLFKIIFLGDTHVGKTALAERITKNDFEPQYHSTVGVDFSTITLDIQDNLIKTHIWDTAGQECFSSIISAYYRGIAGSLVVFDVSRRDSFHKCNFWIEQLLSNGTEGHEPAMILVGNKTDKISRTVSTEEAEKFAMENNMQYYETSARKDINVHACYRRLIEQIYDNMDKKAIDGKHGIRKGMITQSKIRVKDDRLCNCCVIL